MSEGNKYKGSANGDYSGVEEGDRRGRSAAEKGDDARSTQADPTHRFIEAELKSPEAQSPTAVSVEVSRLTWDNAGPTLLDSRLDVSQEGRHKSESAGENAKNTVVEGNEEADNLLALKRGKRKSDNLEPNNKSPMSRKKRQSKKLRGSQAAFKVGSKGRNKANDPQKHPDSFIDLTEISQKVVEPDEVHRILIQQSEEKYHCKVEFLTRLFFAIASPQAFKQLSEACLIVRQHRESAVLNPAEDDSVLMRALDVLDVGTTVRAILRRFYLVRLLDHRIQREDYYKGRSSARVRAKRKQDYWSLEKLSKDADDQVEKDETNRRQRAGRADTKAFADLLSKFYPYLKQPDKQNPSADDREYREKHLKLKNRLNCARNWYLLQQKFSLGILALVPCGEFQIGIDK